ncbi:zinc-ribbon domain-containing protein [Escherichia coli]|uniref:zinc-ribbon domain-containing protein n=1 Tax=Escherichia coli TaxID=562 RepID=UPI00207B9D76|nr:zinc-ribbon domain-containing protein [Escherichia coli]
MYAKSFLALDGNGRLTGARTAQAAPYAHYTCHLCGSALRYHPQYDTELPWFEHTDDRLTEHGQQCPYVRPERREIQLIKRLQQFVPDALPVVRKASWHCRQCHHDYYGELSIAFRIVSSLRIQVTSATFLGFPAASSRM